ncbi:MAG: DUF2927 domain-containing protein [Pseudomonadota bacterium]
MHAPSRWSICGWLICLLPLLSSGATRAADPSAVGDDTIMLLSDEAADTCIQDVDCMGHLFEHAVFGGDQASDEGPRMLFKWSRPVHIASFIGSQVADDVQAANSSWHQQMGVIATLAGSDLSQVEGDADQVVNFVLLISDDFARDRDQAFLALLEGVFAGRSALYDRLASGTSPVCRAELFAESNASIGGGLALVESDVDAAELARCLHRVVLNVLGLRHPLPDGVDSVLSPDSARQAWTSIDFLLLRMLNDPAVTPGMTMDELAAVFPQIHQRALRPSS